MAPIFLIFFIYSPLPKRFRVQRGTGGSLGQARWADWLTDSPTTDSRKLGRRDATAWEN